MALATASQGGRVAWIVPNYKNGRPLWRWAESAVAELVKAKKCYVNRAERTITFEGGGFIGIYSADNPTSILGDAFHLVILDEAARIPEVVWQETIQPTLADFNGDALLISTPKGKNWFYREWLRGQVRANWDEIRSWKAPTSDNPNPHIRQAFERAKVAVDYNTFRQEWQAEFIDDGGEVFRYIRDAAVAEAQQGPIDGHLYTCGVDWGREQDYTVITIIDATTNELVYLDHSRQVDYTQQIDRIEALWHRFHPSIIIPERTGAISLCEQLAAKGLPIRPFETTNASKGILVQALALAFERRAIRIIPDATLITELSAFEASRTPSGLTKYAAPVGMHDDCVMSLCFAWSAAVSLASPRIFFV